jgi:hypothetical protein
MNKEDMDHALNQAFKAVFGQLPPTGEELRRQQIEKEALAGKEISFEDVNFLFKEQKAS